MSREYWVLKYYVARLWTPILDKWGTNIQTDLVVSLVYLNAPMISSDELITDQVKGWWKNEEMWVFPEQTNTCWAQNYKNKRIITFHSWSLLQFQWRWLLRSLHIISNHVCIYTSQLSILCAMTKCFKRNSSNNNNVSK